MSSAGSSSSNAAWPPTRPSKRSKMRNGTFVIPTTGERSRRQFTLRHPAGPESGQGQSSAPEAFSNSARGYIRFAAHQAKSRSVALWRWLNSDAGHQVFKCTLAYLLGSLGTFWPLLSDFLGRRDGKHIVATLTVYFHPARTVGSMLEAILIAVIAVVYAESVSFLSMAVSVASRARFGTALPAHAAVLIIFIGGGLGVVGWVKQRMNQPLVNVASTLASIAIISVITKEESVQDGYFSGEKILQMMKMLLVGISFTVAVNLLVWRVSARMVLRESMITASSCLSDRLTLISRGFLNGNKEEITSTAYKEIASQYSKNTVKMTTSLREAKFEYYFLGREKIYKLDKRLVKSLDSLYQAIGGLRSALDSQFTLLEENVPSVSQAPRVASPEPLMDPFQLSRATTVFDNDTPERLAVIKEDVEPRSVPQPKTDTSQDDLPMFRAPSDIFSLFMALLGPSTKSLAYTLSETLREPPFGQDPTSDITVNDQLRESLRDALNLYHNARGNALKELYSSIEYGRSRSEKIEADIEEVAAACGHFSFSLQAVAEEMDSYLDLLEDLKLTTETSHRSWKWLSPWGLWERLLKRNDPPLDDPENDSLLPKKPIVKGLKKSALPRGIPESMVKRRDSFHWNAAPQASSLLRSASQKLLRVLRFLSREDVLFGIKVGIGAVLWAQFAFIPTTRPIYQHWRGEWGLLSYMIVVGMTTGASNTSGTARFMGTIIGGTCACISWSVSQGNAYVLATLGCIMAVWNFYLVLVVKNGPLGRICLLTYNVIVLYAYSLSQDVDDDDDDEGGANPLIFDITYHRMIAVTLGIVWGMVVCRLLWPISGRRKFREGISVLYLQLGLIWKRGPLETLLSSNSTLDYMREGEQAALQRYAFKLESLRISANSEFELRGPFPHEAYGRIMHSTRHILDGFYAMRLITQKRTVLSDGERALLEYTVAERRLLCQRICHMLQVLASCMMLEYPLTDAIPSIEHNRDHLLGKIYQFRRDHSSTEQNVEAAGGSEAVSSAPMYAIEKDYALLYAYTLVTTQVAAELKKVRTEIEGLFGVLHAEELLLE